MSIYYFDTSAHVKYYVTEPGSAWVTQLIEAQAPSTTRLAHTIVIARATVAEVSSALAILRRQLIISKRQCADAYAHFLVDIADRFVVVDVAPLDFHAAAELSQRHPLKAYDAVQLAVALCYRTLLTNRPPSLTFVSGDRTLLTAAALEGLHTNNPFDHIMPEDTSSSST